MIFVLGNLNYIFAQDGNDSIYPSKIIIYQPIEDLLIDHKINFIGKLQFLDGSPIPYQPIIIKDDITFGTDRIIAKGETNSEGIFEIPWIVENRKDVSGNPQSGEYNIYAIHEKTSVSDYSRSNTISFAISEIEDIKCQWTPYSKWSLAPYEKNRLIGESISISGTLTNSRECPRDFAQVYLVNFAFNKSFSESNMITSKDMILGKTITDSDGNFTIYGIANVTPKDLNPEIYLVYLDENSMFSDLYKTGINVKRFSSSITLNSIPTSINAGEIILFEGKLNLENTNPQGSAVYILDEDPLNADDLLVTAYVNSDGTFSASWIAENVDVDGVADIYAVYEATNQNYRTTSCDNENTFDFGGLCKNTLPIEIIGESAEVTNPFNPSNQEYVFKGNEFMKLYYALEFSKNPTIAIILQPDSIDDLKKYITPVKEGIVEWSNLLEETSGDWEVDFDILMPGDRFQRFPDIIINIVSFDEVIDCKSTRGVAWVTGEKPLNSKVCATSYGKPSKFEQVSYVAGHEFIHTVGLGHAFNKPGDVMCSVEQGKATCPNNFFPGSKPSKFNLAAIRALYGNDGWKNPNNNVEFSSKFTVDDFKNNIEYEQKNQSGIPDWVKNNAKWWSEKKLDDNSFFEGISFLVKEKIINIVKTQNQIERNQYVPDWVKNNAKWWSEEKISNEEFLKGIKYLIEIGIIVVN